MKKNDAKNDRPPHLYHGVYLDVVIDLIGMGMLTNAAQVIGKEWGEPDELEWPDRDSLGIERVGAARYVTYRTRQECRSGVR